MEPCTDKKASTITTGMKERTRSRDHDDSDGDGDEDGSDDEDVEDDLDTLSEATDKPSLADVSLVSGAELTVH